LADGSYTVTPALAGYSFTPVTTTVTLSGANSTANNFVSAALRYSISGIVSGAVQQGVTINLTGASTATASTDAGGNYTFPGLVNGSYTISPSLTGYTFNPTSSAVTVSGSNVIGRNFTAAAIGVPTYSISGTVSGAVQQGVLINLTGTATANTTTSSSGSYSLTGLANGAYTVTPSLTGYTFSPVNAAVAVSGASVSGKNFTATAAPPPPPGTWLWGVTTDGPTTNTAQQVDALKSLPLKTMVRTVFDLPSGGHPAAADYAASVTSLAAVANVMGLPVDSSYMPSLTLAQVQARITEYLGALGPSVAVWEIGNEVNGNWLGTGVVPKIEAMYDAVKAAGKPAALTFYYENPATPGYDLIPWTDANIPPGHRMRAGLDYVLVSYYEDQNNGHQLTQAELNSLFSALATRFPNAKLGFGEFGWGNTVPTSDATRADMLRRFYGYRVPSVPAYIGAGFYWHFLQTMVPKTSPDWTVLSTLEAQSP
jgi:hypothetical protein